MQTAIDEVVVMPAEEYLKLVNDALKNIPFVAVNASRSVMHGERADEGYPGLVGLVAVGFDGDHTVAVPEFMMTLTNHTDMVIGTNDPELVEVLTNNLAPRAVPLEPEPDTDITAVEF